MLLGGIIFYTFPMGRASEVIIPARFLLTMGHFVSTVLAFYGRAASVSAGLAGSTGGTAYSSAYESLTACLSISIICFAIQLYGIFSGATIFRSKLGVFHAVAQFFGGVLTAWYLIDSWGYISLWCVVGRGGSQGAATLVDLLPFHSSAPCFPTLSNPVLHPPYETQAHHDCFQSHTVSS